ncbi:MAG: TetR/AcrR family transcriptional regulator [Opitutales bacterium]
MSDKREEIIQVATGMVREGGYNAFSFREIADRVGVKSSSVHHYFRRKEDLAEMVAKGYHEGFMQAIGPRPTPEEGSKKMLKRYGQAFLDSFNASGKACLCGILSHESTALPEPVNQQVSLFVDANIKWLSGAFAGGSASAEAKAKLCYTALSASMGVAALKGDVSWIETVLSELQELL